MIHVNLAPELEIEEPNWWVGDAIVFGLSLGAAFLICLAIGALLDSKNNRIEAKINKYRSDARSLAPKIAKYKDLNKQSAKLELMITELSKLYENEHKLLRPIVWLENLQRMKPQGVWLSEVSLNDFGKKFTVNGGGESNSLVAEFIRNLRSVEKGSYVDSDPRTWFAARGIQLEQVGTSAGKSASGLEGLPRFTLNFSSGDKSSGQNTSGEKSKK